MISAWTKHLDKDPQAKERFEQLVKGSKELLNRLEDIIKELENSLDRSEINVESFDNPNWHFLQAYKNGYRGALSKLKTLITVKE